MCGVMNKTSATWDWIFCVCNWSSVCVRINFVCVLLYKLYLIYAWSFEINVDCFIVVKQANAFRFLRLFLLKGVYFKLDISVCMLCLRISIQLYYSGDKFIFPSILEEEKEVKIWNRICTSIVHTKRWDEKMV